MTKADDMIAKTIKKAAETKVARAMKVKVTTLPAQYLGTDSEGKGWVMLPGSDGPTPIRRSAVEAKAGDTVAVTIGYGRATVDSNISNPSAGTAGVAIVRKTAQNAQTTATAAAKDAQAAIGYATSARAAANDARSQADIAAVEAQNATNHAQDALGSAQTAREASSRAEASAQYAAAEAEIAHRQADAAGASAASALYSAKAAAFGLSDVEQVVGTVRWIAEHGRYVPTDDDEVRPDSVYYTRSHAGYELTTDEHVVEGTTYYTRDGETEEYTVVADPVDEDIASYYVEVFAYSIVTDPTAEGLAGYYVLEMSEGVAAFLASHIWQTDAGLNVAVDRTDFRAHIGTVDGTQEMGFYVLDGAGNVTGKFASGQAQVGDASGFHVSIEGDGLFLKDGDEDVAYIALNEQGKAVLYVTRSVVVEDMRFGNWKWYSRANGNMALKYVG